MTTMDRNLSRWFVALAVMACAAVFPAAPAVAQAAGTPDERLAGRLDASTRGAVVAQLDSARLSGLPVEPLVDRALEGASKRSLGRPISGGDIVAAVRRLREALGSARGALGDGASPVELAAGASAIQAHVGVPALVALREARTSGSLTIPLGVLTDLVALGVPPDTAARSVIAIARAQDAVLLAYQRDVERDVGVGAAPSVAASVRAAGLEREMANGLHSGLSSPTVGPKPPLDATVSKPPARRKP